jgi:hypothetical protein
VILCDGEGKITLEDVVLVNKEVMAMLREGHHASQQKVHLVIKVRPQLHLPSPLEIRNKVTYLNEPNLGHVIIGGTNNPFIHFVIKIMSRFSRQSLTLESSIEQGLKRLQAKDPSLPDLLHAYKNLS